MYRSVHLLHVSFEGRAWYTCLNLTTFLTWPFINTLRGRGYLVAGGSHRYHYRDLVLFARPNLIPWAVSPWSRVWIVLSFVCSAFAWATDNTLGPSRFQLQFRRPCSLLAAIHVLLLILRRRGLQRSVGNINCNALAWFPRVAAHWHTAAQRCPTSTLPHFAEGKADAVRCVQIPGRHLLGGTYRNEVTWASSCMQACPVEQLHKQALQGKEDRPCDRSLAVCRPPRRKEKAFRRSIRL